MQPTQPADHIADFTLKLLRTSCTLTELFGDLVDSLPPEAYPGEEPAQVVLEMLAGSIRTFLTGVEPRQVRQATDLIAGAAARVVEHLELALALRRRMERNPEGGASRSLG